MVPISLGTKISAHQLPDHGPYEDGDGWHAAVSFKLRGMKSGQQLIYKTTSFGGLAAVGELMSVYGHHLAAGGSGVPIIRLEVGHYPHRKYGRIATPSFVVVEWSYGDDPTGAPAMLPSRGGSPLNEVEEPAKGLLDDQSLKKSEP
jgi:hypothetical protein